ncbi:hypothetical protein ACXITP_00040 [Actinotignum sanguinis]|uniref:Tetratricopeptide repeat protein n=6 Tax=Actinomycetaceae TaxID=2049 RepID=A0ABZ0RCG3_9ACTO|nr:hypothetical protein [Actinotignum sanguinis]WPJ88685.1 hypothetical protein R0V15_07415 [Schaalia turicensis]MDE1552544.1 hypothetical protein [Actinotignum sanguinis]MDE1566093.1 hypothetical protein [Actinotignum sanguinis]MDE1576949.1 hypothetical protein [Actinotignum sanguinis]MDE1641992.1 hypothetical protein [Actinotignum sanguinis]
MHATVTELLRAGLAALERHNESEARARFVEARETERRAAGGAAEELFSRVTDADALYFAALATGQLGENPLELARRAVEAYRAAPPSLRAARAWETYGYFLHDGAHDAAAAQAMREAAGVYAALGGHDAQQANALYNAGISYAEAGDVAAAIAALEAALLPAGALPEVDLGRVAIRATLAAARLDAGQFAAAARDYAAAETAFAALPGQEFNAIDCAFGRARAVLSSGDYPVAAEHFAQVAARAAELAGGEVTGGEVASGEVTGGEVTGAQQPGADAAGGERAAWEVAAMSWHHVAVAQAKNGAPAQGVPAMEKAAAIYAGLGEQLSAAHCRGLLGDLHAEARDMTAARTAWQAGIAALEAAAADGGELPAGPARDLEEFRRKLSAAGGALG